jgi:four helix bundle protein
MFLQLKHTKLDVFQFSQELALECYRLTKSFPDSERFAMISQIRRAALSVHLNVAEGCSRKSVTERKRFYEIARGSAIEIDTAIGIAFKLSYVSMEHLTNFEKLIITTYKILSGLIGK